MTEKIKKNKTEIVLVIILLAISALAHGYNMFHYPAYFDDEGTYMSQAWAVLEKGELSHYTYWYDHPPLGWIQIAVWAKITGGFDTFGPAINSGRVLMFIFSILNVALTYLISKHITKNTFSSFFASMIYAISPLVISLQRMVFLDNIMVVWLLLSILFIIYSKSKIRYVVLSGISFSIALLSKETAIIFVPCLLFLTWSYLRPVNKRLGIILWTSVVGILGSTWLTYALLKGEFFPQNTWLGGKTNHVSLVGTMLYQASRVATGPFKTQIKEWFTGNIGLVTSGDPVILYLGIIAYFVALSVFFFQRSVKKIFIITATTLFILFLFRGGILLHFYIIPLLPFITILIAQLISNIIFNFNKTKKYTTIWVLFKKFLLICSLVLIILIVNGERFHNLLFQQPTKAQVEATQWIIQNIDKNSVILVDNYAFVDLQYAGFPEVNTIYYWKASKDPVIREDLLKNNWENIKYILATKSVTSDMYGLPMVLNAYNNATSVASFDADGYDLNIMKVISNKINEKISSSQIYYNDNFIQDGHVLDPYTNNRTVSEGQGYAMLRSVWMNDREQFEGVWKWTKDNLQIHQGDALFAWEWVPSTVGNPQIDFEAALDADQDIALALLFAHKQWGEQKYYDEALSIIHDIWEKGVFYASGTPYLAANTQAMRNNGYLVNPSYLSPAYYRIFAKVDKKHDWLALTNSSYSLLEKTSKTSSSTNTVNLPPDWILVSTSTDTVIYQVPQTDGASNQYGYDAFRVMWRVALDAVWNQEPRAKQYLKQYKEFFENEWKAGGPVSVYKKNGERVTSSGNISTDVGALSVFTVTNPELAEKFYEDKIASSYNENGYWEEPNNYYGQNWAWFGTALYANKLKNILE